MSHTSKFLSVAMACILLCSCSTTRNGGAGATGDTADSEPGFGESIIEELKAVGRISPFVAGVVVLMPLSPFIIVHDSISNLNRTRQKERFEHVFDPIYRERTALITARSPERDARDILEEGIAFYFPATLDEFSRFDAAPVYPGVGSLLSEVPEKEKSYEKAMESNLGKSLWTLLKADPAHEKLRERKESVYYYSDTFREFIRERYAYMEKFNLTVFKAPAAPN